MTYTPGRDSRFHYVSDLMHFIEENQCEVCVFRKDPEEWGSEHAKEFPMCAEIEGAIILEQPVDALDDKGSLGVVCSKFKLGNPALPVDPDQLVLGE